MYTVLMAVLVKNALYNGKKHLMEVIYLYIYINKYKTGNKN